MLLLWDAEYLLVVCDPDALVVIVGVYDQDGKQPQERKDYGDTVEQHHRATYADASPHVLAGIVAIEKISKHEPFLSCRWKTANATCGRNQAIKP